MCESVRKSNRIKELSTSTELLIRNTENSLISCPKAFSKRETVHNSPLLSSDMVVNIYCNYIQYIIYIILLSSS